jgi:Cytochrome P460
MKRTILASLAVGALTGLAVYAPAPAQQANRDAALIAEGKLPPDYRDWRLISVAHEAGSLNDLRAVLGNDLAVEAFREGKLPFPDGAIIARLAWDFVSSEENDKAFGRSQSFVAGSPKEGVQFMVKDSGKYASTNGWGFAQFNDGKPVDEAGLKGCSPCHEPAKAGDFVFTHYAH